LLDVLRKRIEKIAHQHPIMIFFNTLSVAIQATMLTHHINYWLFEIPPYIGKLYSHMGYLPKAIFITSLMFFLSKKQYAVLFRFKSKGIYVFLTQAQGQALRVCKKISTYPGRIFLSKPCAC